MCAYTNLLTSFKAGWQRTRNRGKVLPAVGSLSKCLQQLGLKKAQFRSQILHPGPLNVWWGLKYFYVPHPRLCTRRKQGQKKGSQNASSVAGIVVPWLQHRLGFAYLQFWLFLIQLLDHALPWEATGYDSCIWVPILNVGHPQSVCLFVCLQISAWWPF